MLLLSRFDCRPSAEPPVARRPLFGNLGMSDNDRGSSPQSARERKKKRLLSLVQPLPRAWYLPFVAHPKKKNKKKRGITEVSKHIAALDAGYFRPQPPQTLSESGFRCPQPHLQSASSRTSALAGVAIMIAYQSSGTRKLSLSLWVWM